MKTGKVSANIRILQEKSHGRMNFRCGFKRPDPETFRTAQEWRNEKLPFRTEGEPELLKCASVTISRVLYWAIIYPGRSLPNGSSDRGECSEQPTIPASCTGWGLQRGQVTRPAGELLPRLSILTGN